MKSRSCNLSWVNDSCLHHIAINLFIGIEAIADFTAVFNLIYYNCTVKACICRNLTMYTLGETKRWYKLYTDGRVVFIRKDSADILKNEKGQALAPETM